VLSAQRITQKLDPGRVFGTGTAARASFDVLKDLRNRYLLHDENDWMQTVPYAIYADAGNDRPTLGDINCVVLEGTDIAHIGQLRTVVDAACDWITQQIDSHTKAIRADLQGRTYSAVAAMPPAEHQTAARWHRSPMQTPAKFAPPEPLRQ
jgi:hypothetical protein